MKYTTINPNNLNMSPGREFVSLSPKLSSSVQDGFSYQYNSPKTLPAKGFVLPHSNNENLTVLTRPQKETSLSKQLKAKGLKNSDNSTPSHKNLITMTLNQTSGQREEKRTSSSKTKGESLRTMSSTPKGTNPYKSFEPLRTREDSSYSSNQYRWKKLEISTEFNNTKTSYASKAQTTKHTEMDENVTKDSLSKASITQQSLQMLPKSLQNKNENVQNYSFYAQEAKARDEKNNDLRYEQKARSSRPLSNSELAAKNQSLSPQRELTKENLKTSVYLPTEKDYNAPRTPAKKKKNSLNLTAKTASDDGTVHKKMSNTTTQFDLKSTQLTAENESSKKKTRALSAKKVTQETREDQQIDKSALKGTPQKASLHSFVSQVNKGDVFSSIKKYGDKRDNSVKKPQKKPSLNFDEKASKSVKTSEFELKGSKTTPNLESKAYSINLSRNQAGSIAQKPKETKHSVTSPKESVRTVQDASVRSRNQEPFVYHMTGLEKAYRWNGEPDYFVQIYREHFLQSYQALTFVNTIKSTDPSVIAQKKVNLPRREAHKNRRTLVFDMDETLIHCNESADMPCDVILPILFPNGEVVEAGVNVRPYAIECLKELSQYYEIVVFTASHSCYANVVLDYLDPQGLYIHHRLFRESCVVTDEGVHIKDLRVIGNRNLQDLVLIDNAAYSFGFQIDNGIPIIPFYDNPADQELRHLTPYLKFLGSAKDMRDINRETFKLHMYTSFDTPEEVLERIMIRD